MLHRTALIDRVNHIRDNVRNGLIAGVVALVVAGLMDNDYSAITMTAGLCLFIGVSWYRSWVKIRCPRCAEDLRAQILPSRGHSTYCALDEMTFCPFCGVDFDSSLEPTSSYSKTSAEISGLSESGIPVQPISRSRVALYFLGLICMLVAYVYLKINQKHNPLLAVLTVISLLIVWYVYGQIRKSLTTTCSNCSFELPTGKKLPRCPGCGEKMNY